MDTDVLQLVSSRLEPPHALEKSSVVIGCDMSDYTNTPSDEKYYLPPDRLPSPFQSQDPDLLLQAVQPLIDEISRSQESSSLIEEAVALLRRALTLAPAPHVLRPDILASLGRVLQIRFAHSCDIEDIENAALHFKEAAELLMPVDTGESVDLNDDALHEVLGSIPAIERDVAESTSFDPDLAAQHGRIGFVFWLRYLRTPATTHVDLTRAIHHFGLASNLCPPSSLARADWLNNLSRAHHALYKNLGVADDTTHAVIYSSLASDIAPIGSQHKISALYLLGSALISRAKNEPLELKMVDLEDAARELGLCVNLLLDGRDLRDARERASRMSDDDPDRPAALVHLAQCALDRYEQLGQAEGLESGIENLKSAIDLRAQSGLPWGDAELDHVISAIERALSLSSSPTSSTSTSHLAEWLGLVLLERTEQAGPEPNASERVGVLGDAERAERHLQYALDSSYPNDNDTIRRGLLLVNLGIAVLLQFRLMGRIDDFGRAVQKLESARELLRNAPPHLRARPLSQLGAAYREAFAHFGEPADLVQAIESFQSAIDVIQDKSGLADLEGEALDNLADALLVRFRHIYAVQDAERAIRACQRAVEITTIDCDEMLQAARLNRLAVAIQLRYEHLGLGEADELTCLEESLQRAINLTPPDAPSRVKYLGNLASFLRVRYENSADAGRVTDLDRAIVALLEAIGLAQSGNSKIYLRWQLGEAYRLRYALLNKVSDLDEAAFAFNLGACDPFAHAQLRLKLVLAWATLWQDATSSRPEVLSLLPDMADAYATQMIPLLAHIISKLPRFASHNLSVGRRRDEIMRAHLERQALSTAATVAITFGEVKHALEWIETGRGVMWRQLMRLRASVDEVGEVDPARADELRQVARALEMGIEGTGPTDGNASSGVTLGSRASRALAHRHEQLLWDIQDMDGLEHFSLHEKEGDLTAAAQDGPVVIVNVVERRCDALVMLAGGETVHVPLPRLNMVLAQNLRMRFNEYLHYNDVRARGDNTRALRRNMGTDSASIVKKVLKQLWLCVIEPVLKVLQEKCIVSAIPDYEGGHRLPHVTWCPTGPLTSLPLHAAGIYDSDSASTSSRLYNFVVSSYTPSVSSLLHARRPRALDQATQIDRETLKGHSMLVLSLPDTPGYAPLPGTITEAEIIAKHLSRQADPAHDSLNFTLEQLVGSEASTSAVLRAMSQCSWVHLACHGVQDTSEPTNSAFVVHDGRFTLAALMRESLPDVAEFAFLSACQTATGDTALEDEVVHLAAGMLAVGYRSVVGTMWAIGDSDAPVVADAFYERVVNDVAENKSKAYALHDAVSQLRRKVGEDNFVRWVPFVHFGV